MGYLKNSLDRRVVTRREFEDAEKIKSAINNPVITKNSGDTVSVEYINGVVFVSIPQQYISTVNDANTRFYNLERQLTRLEEIYQDLVDPQRG